MSLIREVQWREVDRAVASRRRFLSTIQRERRFRRGLGRLALACLVIAGLGFAVLASRWPL